MDESASTEEKPAEEKPSEKIIKVSPEQLYAEAQRIYEELQLINSHKIVRVYDSVPKLLFFQFMKGVSFGLGSVVGATIVVSILAFLLSHVEFVPILGEWVKAILQEIKH